MIVTRLSCYVCCKGSVWEPNRHAVVSVLDNVMPQRVQVEWCAFGQPAAQQPVGLFVDRLLPRVALFAEADLDAEVSLDVGPADHHAASVPAEARISCAG